jgi:hypothetical protein
MLLLNVACTVVKLFKLLIMQNTKLQYLIKNYIDWIGLSINDSSDKWDEFRRETANVFEDLHRDVDHWYHGLTGEHLPADSLQPFSPYLNIYMTPKELDYTPIAKPLPGYNWLRVDGFVRQTHETFTIPESLRNRQGKLFLFALGSLLTQNVTLMCHVTGILAKSPHKFIVSTGPQHDKYASHLHQGYLILQ